MSVGTSKYKEAVTEAKYHGTARGYVRVLVPVRKGVRTLSPVDTTVSSTGIYCIRYSSSISSSTYSYVAAVSHLS